MGNGASAGMMRNVDALTPDARSHLRDLRIVSARAAKAITGEVGPSIRAAMNAAASDALREHLAPALKNWEREIGEIMARSLSAPPAVGDPVQADAPTVLRGVPGMVRLPRIEEVVGVYFLVRDGAIVYVGQSVNVVSRLAAHARRMPFDEAFYVPCAPRSLDALESALIRWLRPPLNKSVPRADSAQDADVLRAFGFASAEAAE